MIPLLVVAGIAVVAGAPWFLWASLVGFAISPLLGVLAIAVPIGSGLSRRIRGRSDVGNDEVGFLRNLAGSMAAGATMREAVAGGGPRFVDARVRRLCEVGAPMRDVARSLAPRLRDTGGAFEVVADLSEDVGASIAEACHVLAEQAEARQRERGETRVATAQARFSAVVVGVVPLALATLMVLVRGVPEPGGAPVIVPMVAGGVLMVTGTFLVVGASRRAGS